jgi:chaperone required for assembly of F1-ATPase
MKRFYKETAVDLGDGGHRVLLDGRPMRTPAKAVLVVPTRGLAEAIAGEWRAVPEKADINVSHLPLTRLAATGLDRVTTQRGRVIEDTAKYAGSDMLCASRRRGSRCSIGPPGATARRWSSSKAWPSSPSRKRP